MLRLVLGWDLGYPRGWARGSITYSVKQIGKVEPRGAAESGRRDRIMMATEKLMML